MPEPRKAPPTSQPAQTTPSPGTARPGQKAIVLAPKKEAEDESPIIYAVPETHECWGESAITEDQAKELLGWESEAQYIARMMAGAEQGVKEAQFEYGDDFLMKDEEGNKIRCWNNSKNRPYTDGHARKLAQAVLCREWAGPLTMPGETVNGETIVIGRRGQVTSGQHRLIGLILACQIWRKQNMKWSRFWASQPVLESLVFMGASEHPKVLMTLDNVRPRSESDVFYTSEIFASLPSVEKKELSRMLAKAVDLLWLRTGASKGGYQTHGASMTFVDRHQKLIECVSHIFTENTERPISNMRLSPGQCAGVMYLQASCASDGDVYRNADPPSEAKLNFEHWDRAKEFWVEIAKTDKSELGKMVQEALGMLVDEDTGTGGRLSEKLAILTKAWIAWVEGRLPSPEELDLTPFYHQKDNGQTVLNFWEDFGGIDLGPTKKEEGEEGETAAFQPTPEELEEAKAAERKRRAADLAARLNKEPKRAAKVQTTITEETPAGQAIDNGQPTKSPPKARSTTPVAGKKNGKKVAAATK